MCTLNVGTRMAGQAGRARSPEEAPTARATDSPQNLAGHEDRQYELGEAATC